MGDVDVSDPRCLNRAPNGSERGRKFEYLEGLVRAIEGRLKRGTGQGPGP